MKELITTIATVTLMCVVGILVILFSIQNTKAKCQVYKELENQPIECQINENITK